MDIATIRQIAGFRTGGRQLRETTVFNTHNGTLTVSTKRALISTGGRLIADIKDGVFVVEKGQYASVVVDPILETIVSGSSVPGPGVSLFRYLAERNGQPATQVSAQFTDWSKDQRLTQATQVIDMDQASEIRLTGGILLVARRSSATDTVGDVANAPIMANVQYVCPAASFPFGVVVTNFAHGDVPCYLSRGDSDNQADGVRIYQTVNLPNARASDYYGSDHDAYTFSDGVGHDSKQHNPAGTDYPLGMFARRCDGMRWLSLDAPYALRTEPVFALVVAKLSEDQFDAMCRIECTLGRLRTYTAGEVIEQVCSISFARGPQKLQTGLNEYVFGFDVIGPFTHVRVRNIYAPYQAVDELPAGHIQVYGIPWRNFSLRDVTR